ncbi:MAG: ATP-dependent DNA helicase RecQ [Candidatus Pacebacteria bacterium]|nr:ATP-dependent DNA helicase RecQ [Candidatus Paceibacterota bacterium]PIZ78473.1 MAG: DNA helicase RecQ [Candidatus Pacebacteria bacterium CG_4_10_14_0_2_um_filter_40_20]PJA69323.1 MAG: DNA helicase RecQ [Candidatus Pacebacteria bacterium CG_4_9_14_3_um_filter_40_12]PJC42006.1 MAG: DNA helicase RecQ [Candidatus Pacebacteria bacterium CG_4_9_14_0_2_um_filter_40_15]
MEPETILTQYWGYTSFRPGQKQIITSILSGKDTVAVLPTGAGKSICFQVPALILPGITIVISPLISLMQDQVDALTKKGIPATFINSSLSPAEKKTRMALFKQSKYKIVYVSPEKFISTSFSSALTDIQLSMLVIDEAHCVSIWGNDFRPSYAAIATTLQKLSKRPPILAVTATATKMILTDISQKLQLHQPNILKSSVARKNLSIQVLDTPTTVIKLLFLLEIVQKHRHQDGIIYASTRKGTEYIAKILSALLPEMIIQFYHGGLEPEQRSTIQTQFISGKTNCIAATNAFGMGVDKPNIRYVVHYDTPISVENYSQEIGRAGRDGNHSDCYTFFCETDRTNQLDFHTKSKSQNLQRQILNNATKMKNILLTKSCKSKKLSAYFDTKAGYCTTCSSCLSKKRLEHSLTRAIEPKLFQALKKIRSENNTVLPNVSQKILATLHTKPTSLENIPGMGTAFLSSQNQITHLFPEENDKILT